MKIMHEDTITTFHFWSGAEDRAKLLTYEEKLQVEQELEELYPDGIDATQLNDLFWFDFEWIAELLGTTEDELIYR